MPNINYLGSKVDIMRSLFCYPIFLVLLLVSCNSELYFEDAICIQNISTIDPTSGLLPNQTVILQKEKIVRIFDNVDFQLSDKNNIIDGTGKFLIPGLWDAHVHFAYIEELAPSMFDLFLRYGITSVRDTGGKLDFVNMWKQRANENPTKAPRVMIAGPLLDGEPNVYDGSTSSLPPLSVGLEDEAAVIKAIDLLQSRNVDLLKAYEMLTPAQFILLNAIAKERGLKVTGHVPLSMDVISASNAGMNSMEHLRNLELSCAENAEELLLQRQQLLKAGSKDQGGVLRSRIHAAQRQEAIQNFSAKKAKEVLDVLAENQTWQIPTLALNTSFVRKPFLDAGWQASFQYMPDSIATQWKTNIEDFTEVETSGFREKYNYWMINIVGRIHDANIDIMAGTDCPIFFLTPGRSLHEELAMLVEAGLSPLEAIKTGTLNPARYFDMEHELGSIKEGLIADLLILDKNPLLDINNTQSIATVIKHGQVYEPVSVNPE